MSQTRTLILALSIAVAAVGCSKSKDDAKTNAPPPKQAEQTAPPKQAEPPKAPEAKPVEGPMADALTAYNAIHDALAADKTDGVADAAGKIAAAATQAGEAADDAHKAHYAELATAAGELAKAGDVEAARMAFGEVSKHLVMMMEMNPSLAAGQHMFECPMAKGYQRWIQPSTTLSNPYMGTKMATCGSEVAFGGGAAGGDHDMGGMKHDMGGMKHDM